MRGRLFSLILEEFVAHAANWMSHWSLLAQEDGGAPDATTIVRILNNPLTPLVGLFLLFYFIFILPERRRKAEERQRMDGLKKNDRIITIGGLHGTIVSAPQGSRVVTIKIDEAGNTRVKINRSAVATVVADKSKETEAEPEADKEPALATKDK